MSGTAISPNASVMTPSAITVPWRLMVASPIQSGSPTSAPMYPACIPRTNTGPTFSAPISSVIHASHAPLMKVTPKPQSAQPTSAAQNSGTAPTRIVPGPMIEQAITIESFLPYRSATIPVGTWKTNTVSSMTEPTSTSWSGVSPTCWTK